MTPNLNSLPTELIEWIFKSLDSDEDQLSFRQVSRSLAAGSFYAFPRKFFKHVSVTLTRPGLQRLLSIANDKGLAPHVHSLSVNIAVLSDKCCDKLDYDCDHNKRLGQTIHSTAYDELVAQQTTLLTNEVHSTVYAAFVRAFRSFTNCEEVLLEHDCRARVFQAVKELNERFFWARVIGDEMVSDKVFKVIFSAIGESQARSVTKFHIKMHERRHSQWEDVAERYLPLGGDAFKCLEKRSSHFESAFENLTDLSLKIRPSLPGVNSYGSFDETLPASNSWTPAAYSSLARALASAKAPNCLNLDIHGWPGEREGKALAHFVEAMKLHKPQVKSLNLTFEGSLTFWAEISQEILLSFLRNFRGTLKELRIERVALDGCWEPILVALRDEFQLSRSEIAYCC